MPERKERLWPNNFPSHPTQNFILGHRVGYWKPFNPATASLPIHSLPSPSIIFSLLSYYLFSSHSHFPFVQLSTLHYISDYPSFSSDFFVHFLCFPFSSILYRSAFTFIYILFRSLFFLYLFSSILFSSFPFFSFSAWAVNGSIILF